MQSYFSAIQPHLEDHVDIAIINKNESSTSRVIASIGIDNLIFTRDLSTEEQNRIYLPENSNCQCIAESPSPNCCILGAQNGSVEEFNIQNQQSRLIFKSDYKINSLTTSPSKRYLAVASEESKCILVDIDTLRSSKCRPGHESGVVNATFSEDEKYLASIGVDKTLFIYSIQNFDQPVERFHFKISKTQAVNGSLLRGTFHKVLHIFYAPGMKELQIAERLNNKWEYRQSKFIKHTNEVIHVVKILKTSLMATCSENEFMIWNNKTEEKLIVVDNFSLNKIIEVGQTFWGSKNDGRIFAYKKVLDDSIGGDVNQERPQRMELENDHQNNTKNVTSSNNNEDIIMFDDEAQEDDSDQDQQKSVSEQSYKLQKQKKTKADRLITAFPQEAVTTQTSQFDNAFYLRTSNEGYLIYRNEAEFQKRIEFESEDKTTTELLFINKEIKYCDFNSLFVLYANDTQYGVKFLKSSPQRLFDDSESWEKNWEDIACVACSFQWVAVANDQEIKIHDVTGNELKSIAFDRIIVAMAAYQNILAVVYHQSIPIDGSQCLAMQLYVINHELNENIKWSSCHVPLKPKSLLKYFRFSNEGMIVTHDDAGYVRVYNLENNTWTTVIIEGAEDSRRIWLLGMKNYRLIYWKTSELNPDPVVFPRLPVKSSRLGTNVTTQDSQRMRQYPFLMFERLCLDHEKCRSRLWFGLKRSRVQKYPGFKDNIETIIDVKQLPKYHNQLDIKFVDIIKFYLENPKTHMKALMAVKTLIRTIRTGEQFIEIFDKVGLRSLALDLENYLDEKKKEIEYEKMAQLQLNDLKIEAEKCIKPKGQNNPFNKKKPTDFSSIPSLNNSQLSQASNFDNLSQRSTFKAPRQNGMNDSKMANKPAVLQTPHKQELVNPYLKKKSTQDELNLKTRQIEEQIEKYGIKKKADIPKRNANNNKM